jgi:hypothetical protein
MNQSRMNQSIKTSIKISGFGSYCSRRNCSHFAFEVRVLAQYNIITLLAFSTEGKAIILQMNKRTTMSNYNVPTNTTDTADTGGCDEEECPSESMRIASCVTMGLILVLLVCIAGAACILGRARATDELSAPATVQQEQKDEKKREQRKEWVSKLLVVREWSPDDATVENSKPTSEENSTTDEQLVLESVPQTSDCASCTLGSDDCESFLEEAQGCAICLSHFKPHQLVCESNNLSCDHIFHQDCMMDWLMKHRRCPLCRELYLLKTV